MLHPLGASSPRQNATTSPVCVSIAPGPPPHAPRDATTQQPSSSRPGRYQRASSPGSRSHPTLDEQAHVAFSHSSIE